MKKVILVFAIVFSGSILFISCKTEKKEAVKTEKVAEKIKYQCPMKCEKEKTYDKEGTCPVCEMKLRKKSKEKESHEGHQH